MNRSPMPPRRTRLTGCPETHQAWVRRSQDTARQKARQAPTRRRVHTPASVVDLIIARSVKAFGYEPEDFPRGLCELCARPAENTHTRRPDGMGGTRRSETYHASNKIRVCGQGNVTRCHGHLERNRTWALEHGLLVPQAKAPATAAVRLGYGRVLLDDAGGFELLDDTTDSHRGNAA